MSEKSPSDIQEQVMPGVTAGTLLEAMENPDSFAELARGDLYVQMAMMRRLASSPEMPMNQRLDYGKFLAKMGKVEQPAVDTNEFSNAPFIKIDLGQGQSVEIGATPGPKLPSDPTGAPAEREVGPKKQSTAVIP